MSYNKFAWYAGKLVPCRNFLSGRSRTRTWDLFLIRDPWGGNGRPRASR